MTHPDPGILLAAVATALNACERAGITIDLGHGAVSTRCGYVVPFGDPRLGSRWTVRNRLPAQEPCVDAGEPGQSAE